jgi:hypothetical protein
MEKSRLQVIDIRRLKEILDFFTLRTKQCPIKLPGRSLFVVVSHYPVFYKLKKDTFIFSKKLSQKFKKIEIFVNFYLSLSRELAAPALKLSKKS